MQLSLRFIYSLLGQVLFEDQITFNPEEVEKNFSDCL